MPESSSEARIYFFACNILWDVLSLFHYLDEEVATENIGALYLEKWSAPFAKLTNWALEERWFPIDKERIPRAEKDLLLSTADDLGDLLALHWSNELNTAAIAAHERRPGASESMWLYYYYCGFLRQVLTEFDRVLQERCSSTAYYEHYREHVGLFGDMAAALEPERPFLGATADVSEATLKTVWGEIDASASELGAGWRQAVYSAAHDLKLPDFGEEV
jgi:hypothetical protein